jgi:hypothetical protein
VGIPGGRMVLNPAVELVFVIRAKEHITEPYNDSPIVATSTTFATVHNSVLIEVRVCRGYGTGNKFNKRRPTYRIARGERMRRQRPHCGDCVVLQD